MKHKSFSFYFLLPIPFLLSLPLYLNSPLYLFICHSGFINIISSYSLQPHSPGVPAVANRCGWSLWCTCGGCSRDVAQQPGRSGGSWSPGFCSICCSWCTTHSWPWEAQVDPAATGTPASCTQVPKTGAGQRWSPAVQPAPLPYYEERP